MTEYQRLFLAQARSDFMVFELFGKTPGIPPCHSLHYLQMATELLAKAFAWKHGQPARKHRAFVDFLRNLPKNRRAQRHLGFEGKNAKWEQLIRQSVPLSEQIEDLAPALANDGPNPEYPWPTAAPCFTPAEYQFEVWNKLQEATGRIFLNFVGKLFTAAESFL